MRRFASKRLLVVLVALALAKALADARPTRSCHQSCYKMGISSQEAKDTKMKLFSACKANLTVKLQSSKSMGCAYRVVYSFNSTKERAAYQSCEHDSKLYQSTIKDYSFVARNGIKDFPCF